ncbi:MAG: PEP-CTERM sorting domain-containing protein [Luteolibacter sp.]
MKKTKSLAASAAVIASLFAATTGSDAALLLNQTVGIDFGGTAPAGSTTFNQVSVGGDASTPGLADMASTTAISLVDTNNTAITGTQFSVTNNTGQIAWDFSGGVEGSGLMTDASVYGDGIISNNASGRNLSAGANFVLTFTGLDDSLTYDLTGGWDNNNNNFNATWSADGKNFFADTTASVGYGTLSGLTTDGSGNLEITVTKSNHVTIAGLTLTAVPEPSSAALLLGGMGVLMLGRRRK